MLSLRDVTLRRGPRALFEHATLTLHAGEKAGLVGANGTGKSSLFALLRGELGADAGEVAVQSGYVLAAVAQEVAPDPRAAVEFVLDGDRELRAVEAALAAAEAAHDGLAVGTLHARLEALDGYAARSRAARLLAGLGFDAAAIERPVATYSGGWQRRLALAQALMARSDILLLDEPTNHLDLDAVLWLEQWLRAYPGTLLVIAHDREFLDRVVSRIVSLEQGRVVSYAGNYSDFEAQRAERLAQQQSAYARQQREIRHVLDFVTRFKAKASKARQAQSRLKQLERLERIAPAHADSPFEFEFATPARLPRPLVTLERASTGYDGREVVAGVEMSLAPGDRVGLLGRNGAGKSTLTRLLAGLAAPLAGRRTAAQDLVIGYFAQHQLEQLEPDASPLAHLRRHGGTALAQATEQEQRSFLGGFGFAGDRVFEPVAPFSGGEKARLVLALIVSRRPNLLLLDEPTNHLDLEMRHALAMALQDYAGAIVLVSHDRYLLRMVADSLWLVAGGRAVPYDGDLDDYAAWLQAGAGEEAPTAPAAAAPARGAAADKERKRREAEHRQRLAPLKSAVEKSERELGTLAAELAAIEARLADPALHLPAARAELVELLARQGVLKRRVVEVEEAWLEASEALEAARAGV
ncbi:MAG: ATP-binding cassette domain-containing protein [Proteobacteria bacterium]|nr:ATP-binding cassette domain-containing protein [Pseudomonadota bacterium]